MNVLKEILDEHIKYKSQIIKLAKSDLIKTYRGAILGWLWALFKPAITIFVYWFAFTIGLRSGKDVSGYPFFLWLIAGIIPWFFMSDMLVQGAGCIKKYSYLVTKMKFPTSTIPTFVSLSKFFVNLCLTVLMIVIFLCFGYGIDIYYLQLPLYMILLFLFWTVWALFSSPLSVLSKDFYSFLKSITTAVFWLSGILWDPATITIPWLKAVLLLNPVTFFATGYRNVFIYKKWFFEDIYSLIGFFSVLIILFLLSLFVFKRLRKEVPDVL